MANPVLVVEDHADSRQLLEDFLGVARVQVVTATNGSEALTMLVHSRPCLILLDLWMPDMDGRSFIEHKQRLEDNRLAGVPVVLVSASLNGEEEARALGAVAFLKKPVDLDRLLGLVRKYAPSAGAVEKLPTGPDGKL